MENQFYQETKKCSKCKKILPRSKDYFYMDSSAKSGFKSRCKFCEGNTYVLNNRYGLFDIKWKELDTLCGIYKIECKGNGKIYIGSAVNICQRWSTHLCELRKNQHGNSYMQYSYNKFGESTFVFTIIESVNQKGFLIEREQFWLDSLKSYDRNIGFNVLKVAGNCLGNKLRDSTKEKLKRVLNKQVIQYDFEGNIIEIHLSAKEAHRRYGYSAAQIYNCANRKKQHYKGYIWIYKEDENSLEERIQYINMSKRTILQFDLEGNLIKEWNCSISKLAKELDDKTYINIPNCCNGNQATLGGYIWRYSIGGKIQNPINHLD